MDPHSSAQDVHRCDLCDTVIVHSYCDFCHVSLCKPCILDHILDEYDKHKIVPFKERKSTLIYPKCRAHPQKNCDLQCTNCNNLFVCSSCTASEQHKGHLFVEVSEVYKTKKRTIEKDQEKLENHIFPKYEEIALNLEYQLANLDGGYEKLTATMSKQGEQWHHEVDIIINRMKTEIGEIKIKHKDILRKHLDKIKKIQSTIKQNVLTMKEVENSTEISKITEYSSKIEEFGKLPPRVQASLPTFIPKPVDREQLYSLFGQITSLSTAEEDSFRHLLDEPQLIATIQTGQEKQRSVACLNKDKIWTCGWTNDIKCFNIHFDRSILQKIKTKSGEYPNDIAVDGDGDLLYSDWKTKTVNKVKNGQTEELIRLQRWKPLHMCITSTGDLLVTMYTDDNTQSKVVRYSGSTETQTIQFDDEGKPLFSENPNLKYITENRNHDICVADWAAGAVVVVNQDGKRIWRYTGHLSVTKIEPFKPRGITSDRHSFILTADDNNQCIHILDKNGQFLCYIDNCDLKDPYGLCIDNDEYLFVSEFYKGNVKKIRYLKYIQLNYLNISNQIS